MKKTLPYLLPGSTAVVIGAGGLGQYAIQYLKLMAATTVIVVETSAAKQKTALALGADHVVDGGAADALEQLRELSGGEGAQATLDFVGGNATMRLGLDSLARQGLFVLVGLAGGSVPLGFFGPASEVAVTTSIWGTHNDLTEVIALAQQGKLVAATETHPARRHQRRLRQAAPRPGGRPRGRHPVVTADAGARTGRRGVGSPESPTARTRPLRALETAPAVMVPGCDTCGSRATTRGGRWWRRALRPRSTERRESAQRTPRDLPTRWTAPAPTPQPARDRQRHRRAAVLRRARRPGV